MAKQRRRRRTTIEIKKDILAFLEKANFPRTTGQIARAVNLNWYAADSHLQRLKAEGVVFHEKVGRQNQWCLMEKYRHGFIKKD